MPQQTLADPVCRNRVGLAQLREIQRAPNLTIAKRTSILEIRHRMTGFP